MGTPQGLGFMWSVVLVGLGSLVGGSVVGAYAEVSFLARQDFGVGVEFRRLTAGDFNADGHPDLATANSDSDTVSILLGNGDGTFQAAGNFGVGDGPFFSITTGDFNADGHPDLATANSDSGSWPLYVMS